MIAWFSALVNRPLRFGVEIRVLQGECGGAASRQRIPPLRFALGRNDKPFALHQLALYQPRVGTIARSRVGLLAAQDGDDIQGGDAAGGGPDARRGY